MTRNLQINGVEYFCNIYIYYRVDFYTYTDMSYSLNSVNRLYRGLYRGLPWGLLRGILGV